MEHGAGRLEGGRTAAVSQSARGLFDRDLPILEPRSEKLAELFVVVQQLVNQVIVFQRHQLKCRYTIDSDHYRFSVADPAVVT